MRRKPKPTVEPLPVSELAERVARCERVILEIAQHISQRWYLGANVNADLQAMRGPEEFTRGAKP
jgi:hypothetical protein